MSLADVLTTVYRHAAPWYGFDNVLDQVYSRNRQGEKFCRELAYWIVGVGARSAAVGCIAALAIDSDIGEAAASASLAADAGLGFYQLFAHVRTE